MTTTAIRVVNATGLTDTRDSYHWGLTYNSTNDRFYLAVWGGSTNTNCLIYRVEGDLSSTTSLSGTITCSVSYPNSFSAASDDGDYICVVRPTSATQYDLARATLSSESVSTSLQTWTVTSLTQAIRIGCTGTDSFVILYHGPSEKVHGTDYGRLYYRTYVPSTDTLGSETIVSGTGITSQSGQQTSYTIYSSSSSIQMRGNYTQDRAHFYVDMSSQGIYYDASAGAWTGWSYNTTPGTVHNYNGGTEEFFSPAVDQVARRDGWGGSATAETGVTGAANNKDNLLAVDHANDEVYLTQVSSTTNVRYKKRNTSGTWDSSWTDNTITLTSATSIRTDVSNDARFFTISGSDYLVRTAVTNQSSGRGLHLIKVDLVPPVTGSAAIAEAADSANADGTVETNIRGKTPSGDAPWGLSIGDTEVSDRGASTPHATKFNHTTNEVIDVVVDAALPMLFGGSDNSQTTLIGKWGTSTTAQSWQFAYQPAGGNFQLRFQIRNDAQTQVNVLSDSSTGVQNGQRAQFRVEIDTSITTNNVKFYYRTDGVMDPNASGWTQLGATKSLDASTIRDTTTDVNIGHGGFGANHFWTCYGAWVEHGSTPVIQADFTEQRFTDNSAGTLGWQSASSFNDHTSNTWTLESGSSRVGGGARARMVRWQSAAYAAQTATVGVYNMTHPGHRKLLAVVRIYDSGVADVPQVNMVKFSGVDGSYAGRKLSDGSQTADYSVAATDFERVTVFEFTEGMLQAAGYTRDAPDAIWYGYVEASAAPNSMQISFIWLVDVDPVVQDVLGITGTSVNVIGASVNGTAEGLVFGHLGAQPGTDVPNDQTGAFSFIDANHTVSPDGHRFTDSVQPLSSTGSVTADFDNLTDPTNGWDRAAFVAATFRKNANQNGEYRSGIAEAGDTCVAVGSVGTGSINGTAAITEAPDSVNADGDVDISGTAAISEVADSVNADGDVPVSGTAAIAEQPDTVAATGSVTTNGTAAITEQPDTAAATGGVEVSGTAAITEVADTAAAAGDVDISGTAAITEAADSVAAAGGVELSGSAAITEQPDTVAALGGTVASGSAAITEAADTAVATGSVEIAGTAAITEAPDTVVAVGNLPVSGTAAITEAADTVAAAGDVDISGTAAITEAADSVNADGSVGSVVSGTAAITEQPDTVAAVGDVPISGTAAITEAPDTVAATGSVTTNGTAAIAEQPDAAAAVGGVEITGRTANAGSGVAFLDDFTGTNGNPWDTTNWPTQNTSGGGVVDIQSNQGRLDFPTNPSRAGAFGSIAVGDFELTMTRVCPSGRADWFVNWRDGGSWFGGTVGGSANVGYTIAFFSFTNGYELRRVDPTEIVVLDTVSSPTVWSPTSTDEYSVRIRHIGSDLKVKVWRTLDGEPGAWTSEVTDGNHRAGGISLGGGYRTEPGSNRFDNVQVVSYGAAEAVDTVAASGSVEITGTAAITEAPDTAAAVGDVPISGTAAIAEQPDTVTAVGDVPISGTVVITESADTVVAAGDVSISGTAAITEQPDTAAATGSVTTNGTAAITEQPDTAAAVGDIPISGSAAILEQPDICVASGAEQRTGSAAITEAADTVVAVGDVPVSGTAAIAELPDSVAAVGSVTTNGTAAITESPDTVVAVGNVPGPIGTVVITEAPDTVVASGSVEVSGSALILELADNTVVVGGVEISGTSAITEAPDLAYAYYFPPINPDQGITGDRGRFGDTIDRDKTGLTTHRGKRGTTGDRGSRGYTA